MVGSGFPGTLGKAAEETLEEFLFRKLGVVFVGTAEDGAGTTGKPVFDDFASRYAASSAPTSAAAVS